jgi:hypothetical protein
VAQAMNSGPNTSKKKKRDSTHEVLGSLLDWDSCSVAHRMTFSEAFYVL